MVTRMLQKLLVQYQVRFSDPCIRIHILYCTKHFPLLLTSVSDLSSCWNFDYLIAIYCVCLLYDQTTKQKCSHLTDCFDNYGEDQVYTTLNDDHKSWVCLESSFISLLSKKAFVKLLPIRLWNKQHWLMFILKQHNLSFLWKKWVKLMAIYGVLHPASQDCFTYIQKVSSEMVEQTEVHSKITNPRQFKLSQTRICSNEIQTYGVRKSTIKTTWPPYLVHPTSTVCRTRISMPLWWAFMLSTEFNFNMKWYTKKEVNAI